MYLIQTVSPQLQLHFIQYNYGWDIFKIETLLTDLQDRFSSSIDI